MNCRIWFSGLFVLMITSLISASDKRCPQGTTLTGGWGTSGCRWEQDCYTAKKAKKSAQFIAKCLCGEMGLSTFAGLGDNLDLRDGSLEYYRSSVWKRGHCVQYESWEEYRHGKWKKTTRAEWEKINR